MWTPVDVRFKDVLESFKRYRRLVQDELIILQAKASNDAKTAAEFEDSLAAEERRRADKDRDKMSELRQQTADIKEALGIGLKRILHRVILGD